LPYFGWEVWELLEEGRREGGKEGRREGIITPNSEHGLNGLH